MQRSLRNKKGNIVVIAVMGILICITLASLTLYFREKQKSSPVTAITDLTVIPSETPNNLASCKAYDYEDLGYSFFPKYTVKSGDSLLSISRDQLGSVSRIGDLVEMNKTKYPSIANQSPFLEVGWELLLPPKEVTEVPYGGIRVTQGELFSDPNSEMLQVNVASSQSASLVNFYPNRSMQTKIQPGVQKEKCVNIVSGYMNDKPVYSVTLQN